MSTEIQWTDETWNPVTGCTKVSPGCAHCYAETVADQFWAKQYPQVLGIGSTNDDGRLYRPREFTDVQTHEDRLDQPLRWKKPRRIFVNSMSDLFHEDVPDAFIDRVFAVMALCQQHTFQLLTKRADRMREYVVGLSKSSARIEAACPVGYALRWEGLSLCPWPLPNVWLGVSVENQYFADERIPLLLQTPAVVRFISAEPLLGPINLREMAGCDPTCRLHWVIVGGESGQKARGMNLAWARNIVQQCRAAGVPVFVKQLGRMPYEAPEGVTPCTSGPRAIECQGYELDIDKGHGGNPVEWPEDLRVREFPA